MYKVLLYSNVIQIYMYINVNLCIYICTHTHTYISYCILSTMVYFRTLNIVLWDVEKDLVVYPFGKNFKINASGLSGFLNEGLKRSQ